MTSERPLPEVQEFARFIAPFQQVPESHMAMVGTEAVGIAKELEEFETQLFVERDGAGTIVGAAGFDYDEPLARGFLYGPWSIEAEWGERIERLFARVLDAAPPTTTGIDTAFDQANERAESFARSHGFELIRDHFFMGFTRGDAALQPDPDIRVMADDDRAAVAALHDRCFENTWPSGSQLLEQLEKGPDRAIFVLYEGDNLAGYHYATVERETGEGFVDNIGVDDAFRGRGLATRLLTHGLWWMFGFAEVMKIELSVREENAAALQVYEKAGFKRLRAIRQMRYPVGRRP
jgi:ribosomal protein S18 acetylase RimI-like enzyme